MQELLVLSGNPSRRRKGKKRRSAAQRAATAKMLAARDVKRRRRRTRKAAVSAAPAVRRRRRGGRRFARRATRRSQRGFMLMGSRSGSLNKPLSIVSPALTGAVGAIGVNFALSKLPLPPVLMTGKARFLTQGAVAIGLGMIANKIGVVNAGTAAKLAEGSLTVTLVDAIREVAGDAGINLSGMGYYLPAPRATAIPASSGAPSPQLGKYITGPGSSPSVTPLRRAGMGNIRRGF